MDRANDTGMTPRSRLSVTAVLCAMAMVVLDTGMLNVSLPSLSAALHVDISEGIWSVTTYQVALLVGLLPAAQFAERFGQKLVFVGGLATYLIASALCAASPALPVLVGSRVLQGFGGAVIMALGVAILRVELGADRLGRVIGWNALVVAVSSAAAPAAAAAILSVAPWPWLFLAKLPFGLVALASSAGIRSIEPTRSTLDPVTMALHASIATGVAISAQLFATRPLLGLAMGAAVVVLIRAMRSRPSVGGPALWPVDLMARRDFKTSVMASVTCFTGQTAGLIALPILLQAESRMSVGETAWVMTCWPLAVAVTAPLSGRLADRFNAPALCSLGTAMLAVGLMTAACTGSSAGATWFALATILCGLGFGLFQVPNNRTLFLSAPPARAAAAGGVQGSARLLGQTLGALLVGLFLSRYADERAARWALGVGSLCASAAAVLSATEIANRIRRQPAVPSSCQERLG